MFDEHEKALLKPEHVAGLRISIAFLVLLPFAVYHFFKLDKSKLLPIIGVGVFGNGIPAFLFTASESGISSSLAGMLNATTPIFAVIISIVIFKTRLNLLNYIGIAIGFIGATWLMLAKGTDQLSAEMKYIGMVLLATFFYGTSVNLIRHKLAGVHPIAIASISFCFIGIPAFIWVLSDGVITAIHASPQHVMAFGYTCVLAVAGTAFAVIMFNYLVQITNAVFASTVTYLMPVVSIGWGLYEGEFFTYWYLLAIAVILLGVYLTNKK